MSTARNMLQSSSSIWKRNTEVTISVVPIADAYYESENPENAGADRRLMSKTAGKRNRKNREEE